MNCPNCGSNPCEDNCELLKQIKWILYEATPEQVEVGLMQHPEFRKIKEDKMK
jgi:hypothetical protein